MERFQLFTVLVSRASRYIRKLKNEEMVGHNLKSTHVSCIYYLYTFGAMTAKELGDKCEEDKANLSRSIEFLEKSGYISPSSVIKKYNTPLLLTPKGQELGAKICEKIDNIINLASQGLTDDEREIFYRSFEKITENLKTITNGD